jgi:hypothetical protein
LYLRTATIEDMKNTTVMIIEITIVESMEVAINVPPSLIYFPSILSGRRDRRLKRGDLTVSDKQTQIHDSLTNVIMRIQEA